MKHGMNSTEMQKRNRILVFKTLLENGGMTRAELAKNLGLQKATITNIINEFYDSDILVPQDANQSKRGEKLWLRIDDSGILVIGITRKGYDTGLFSLDGRLQEGSHYHYKEDDDFHDAIEKLKREIIELVEKYGDENIQGVCLAVPGLYIREKETGDETYMISEFPQWNDINIRNELEGALGREIFVMHDAKLAAYGEWRYADEVKDEPNASLIVIRSRGFGIGCGMVINQKIVEGQLGIAGEIGHMGINFNKKNPEDGTFEASAGTDSAVRIMQERMTEFPRSPLTENSTYDEILIQYREGDSLAEWTFKRLAMMLGYGLANMVYIVNPDCIIIGPDYPDDIRFIEDVKREMMKYVPEKVMRKISIRYSSLKEDSFIVGGYYYLMDQLYKDDSFIERISRKTTK